MSPFRFLRTILAFTLFGPRFSFIDNSAPAVDPQVGEAAKADAAIARESLDFSKQQYADQKDQIAKLQPYLDHYLQSNLDNLDLTNQQNKTAFDDYQTMYRPNEQRYMQDVAEAGSEDKQAAAATTAGAGVQSQIDNQREINARNMASMGVSPDSGRTASDSRVSEVLGAAARSGAEYSARIGERDRGIAARAAAVGVGRGNASLALQGVQVGNQTSSTGVGVGTTAFGMNQQAGAQYLGGLGTSANIGTQGGQLALSNWSAQQQANSQASAGLGSMLSLGAKGVGAYLGGSSGWGAALSMISDEGVKENKTAIKGRDFIKAIKSMRVERWKYHDGVADGGDHIGTYAQDFQKATGIGDGKTIDVASAIGVLQGAVKEVIAGQERMGRHIAALGVV